MRSLSLCLFITAMLGGSALASTYFVTSPETNVRRASLIIEVEVLDMRYWESPQGVSFAIIRLQVHDRIVGESPDVIEIRRPFVTPQLQFLDTEFMPAYRRGERFIITLREQSQKGKYTTLGLYNGKFGIEQNIVQNTSITLEAFKQQVLQVRAGEMELFPAELPRFGLETGEGHRVMKSQSGALMLSCGPGEDPWESHLDDEFRAWDFTWDTNYLPVEMNYSTRGAPGFVPAWTTIATLAELAYELWENEYSFLEFESASFSLYEGRQDDNKSVIVWEDLGNANWAARTFPYPNTPSKLDNCQAMGRGSNRSMDIVLNNNDEIEWEWHFGSNPPLDHSEVVDFVEILAHELGHGLGLAHTNKSNSIMYALYNFRNGPVR